MLIDIHSHIRDTETSVFRLFNVMPVKQSPYVTLGVYGKNLGISTGIHPWDALDWSLDDVSKLMPVFGSPEVLLIGEIGLDKSCQIPFDKQGAILKAQVSIADTLRKPVILHVVRAMSELLALKKAHPNVPAWIVHGFRGGRQEAEQYISHGFYVSFSEKHVVEGLKACPLEKLFAETDESGSLHAIYKTIAEVKQVPFDHLKRVLYDNFCLLFPQMKSQLENPGRV